ncbi:hypothetical protein RJ640_011467 [Escallonia rubra]|uniref:Pectinesterase inhibitor domain-containing protein n=1 Tax=Escallonia rubra TaxID=112253 RepID=A0AA88R0N1_9ASTE|nr:hypothetical protein RJ640_011467 [Escallonia rubra]
MAFSSSTRVILVSLLLAFSLTSLTFARPNVRAQDDDLIGEVCSKTRNPSFCVQALKSDPPSGGADLRGLGQISIDLAQASATATSSLIDSLIKQTNDPKLRERYKSCSENYSDSIGDLGEAKGFLNSGDYGSVNIRASAALDGADTCDGGFAGPPAEPAELKQANQKLEDLCSIILVISNRLA